MPEFNAGFLSIFNNHHIVMLLVDPASGQIVDANPAAVQFYGYGHEKMCGMTISQINALSEEQLKCNLAKAHELKECHFILKHRIADGRICDIEAFCGPIKLDDRQLLYSINFDITGRLKMENDVVRNRDRLKSIVKILQIRTDNINDILENALNEAIELTSSKIGFILRYNHQIGDFSLVNWSKSVMQECRIEPPQGGFKLDHAGIWAECVKQRQPILVNDYQAPDCKKRGLPVGHVAIKNVLVIPVFTGDEIVAVVGVGNKEDDYDQNDSLQLSLLFDAVWKAVEKIESQRKVAHLNKVLRGISEVNRLIARAGDPISLADSVCRVLAETRGFNGAILILTDEQGNSVETVCSGMYVDFPEFSSMIKSGHLPECCIEAMQRPGVLLIKDRSRFCHDCPISKDCEGLTSLISAMKFNDELYGFMGVCVADELFDSEEEAGLFAGLAEDVALALHNLMMRSAKKLAEIDRDSLHSQLIQAQKIEAIGQLAGGVAHDFNNLLSVILGYGEILMQDISSESVYFEPMSEIYAAAERAKNLTRQLLAFSRKQIFELKIVQVNQIVAGFEKFLRRIVGEQIRVELKLCDTEALVKADVSQIEQALMNLAINARDAMPEGGILTIETGIHYFDEVYASEKIGLLPGNYAMLAISDTGVGIDKETMEHMFEPFYTTKGVEKGTGLGLSTAFGIVKQHNGHIWAYSELGKGSVFKVFLPLTAGMEDPSKTEQAKEGESAFSHATIMVVEDDLLVRRLACKILVRQGYRVLEAENFDTAVELASSFAGKIDLLLSDVIMPGKEGPEVFKAISKMCPDIKVLYMSGYSPAQISHLCKLDSSEAFVQKPISVSALLGKVSRLLRGKKKG